MIKEINVIEIILFDKNLIVYVFCKFDLYLYKEILFGIVKKMGDKDLYKVIMYIEEIEWCFKFLNNREIIYKCYL